MLLKDENKRDEMVDIMSHIHQYVPAVTSTEEITIWGRFVNTSGLPGRNISNNLHMEHLNRVIKTSIQNLGSSKTEAAITRLGKVLRILHPVLQIFDQDTGVSSTFGKHKKPKEDKDINIIIFSCKAGFPISVIYGAI